MGSSLDFGTTTTGGAYFFLNTEYVGVAQTHGYQFPQPICVHFNADSTVTAYAVYNWAINGGDVIHDSLVGKITSVSPGTGGSTAVAVTFPESNDQQVMTISADKSGLTGGSITSSSASVATQFGFPTALKLAPTKAVSVTGTYWNTDTIKSLDGTNGNFEYPDLRTFQFNQDGATTSYTRSGEPVVFNVGIGEVPTLLTVGYRQIGSRLYFNGYDEEFSYFVLYFGVLSPDGTTIYADCRNLGQARVPLQGQTMADYGPAGSTPTIHKQHSL